MSKTYVMDDSFAKVASGEWTFEDWMAQRLHEVRRTAASQQVKAEEGPEITITVDDDKDTPESPEDALY